MTHQPNPTEATIAAYDHIAAEYTDRWHGVSLAAEIDRFAAYLNPRGLILDVGCGSGRDMVAFADRGFRTVGIDRSAGMLKIAAQNGAGSLVQADARRLPFAKNVFQGVWACASLLHVPKNDLPTALKESNRVLRHGHIYLSLKKGDAETWHGNNGQMRFFAYYHPAEVELALDRTGFHVLDVHLSADAGGRDTVWINAIGWTKLETPRVGACTIIFNDIGQVLLTRRADNGKWCVPGGHMDMDETIQQTAIRETKEETGLDVEIERMSGMYSVVYPADIFPEKKARSVFIVAFRCKILGGKLTLNEEVTEFGWFDPHRLPDDMLVHHKIRILDALV